MSDKKRLILNLFEMNCVSHITHGLWRLPDNNRERFNDIEYWIELARLLEEGGFDAVFLADVVGHLRRLPRLGRHRDPARACRSRTTTRCWSSRRWPR